MQIELERSKRHLAKPLPLGQEDSGLSTDAPMFNFGGVLRILRRRTWMIVLVAAAVVALVWTLLDLAPNSYRARASLLLEEAVLEPFRGDQLFTETNFNNQYIESQMLVIQSPLLASQVVSELGLDKIDRFMKPPQTKLRTWIDAKVSTVSELVGIPVESEIPRTESEQFQAAVEKLRENLSVTRAGLTLVLNIGFTSSDPDLSALIANAVANTYIANRRDLRRASAVQASDWFEERMSEIRAKALSTEASITHFRSGGEPTGVRTEMDLSVQDQLRRAISERLEKQTTHDRLTAVLASERPLTLLPPRLMNDRLRELKERHDSLVAERTNAEDPAEVDRAIAALEREIKAELGRYVTVGKEELAAALARESAARDLVAEGREVAPGLRGAEFELRNLEAEARIYRQLYESYFESYLRMVQQQSFPTNEATLIATALPPDSPLGPGKSRLLPLAAIVGFTLGIGGAFLRETADDRLRSRAQLKKLLGAPTIGILPIGSNRPKSFRRGAPPDTSVRERVRQSGNPDIANEDKVLSSKQLAQGLSRTITEPFSAYTDTIRRIKSEVDSMTRSADIKGAIVIGFVSDEFDENTSVAAMNFAELLAVAGNNTLLIDLNWIQSYLTATLTPKTEVGVIDLVQAPKKHNLEETAWIDVRSGMNLLPNRALVPGVTVDPSVFDSDVQRQWLQSLRSTYDYIVIDFAALSESIDAAALADQVFGLIFFARWGVTNKKKLVSSRIPACRGRRSSAASSARPRTKVSRDTRI